MKILADDIYVDVVNMLMWYSCVVTQNRNLNVMQVCHKRAASKCAQQLNVTLGMITC